MNNKELYENAAKVVEGLTEQGFTMEDFAQFVRELGERNLSTGAKEKEMPVQLHQRVTKMMHEVGIPAHIKGYQYVRAAIEDVVVDPKLLDVVTKKLYPGVAKEFGTTPSRVERAIRHAIECAWDRGAVEVFEEYFGNTVSAMKGKPTNSEFIAMLADHIRNEQM